MQTRIVLLSEGDVPSASGLETLRDVAALVLPGCHMSIMMDDREVQVVTPASIEKSRWSGHLEYVS